MNPSAPLLSYVVIGVTVALVPITGVFAALMPYLMPKRECFAVTVPDAAQADPVLRQLKRRYAAIMVALTALLTVGCVVAASLDAIHAMAVAMGVSVIGLCVASYGLMLHFRSKVQGIKRERGWLADGAKSAAVVNTGELARPLSLRWDLLFIPLAVACLTICWAGYDVIPEEVPTQINLGGQVTTYMHKSPLVACFPALVTVFIDGMLAFAHWSMLRSKKYADPAAPAQTAWAYARFLRAQTILIVVAGILCGAIALTMAFSFVGLLTIEQSAVVCLALVLVIVGASIGVSVVYGQNGSRLIAHMPTDNGTLLRDNDRYWKLGIFYVNRNDPALFLPERFSVGWTMNWGRPAAWGILVALVAIIVGFMALVLTMGR